MIIAAQREAGSVRVNKLETPFHRFAPTALELIDDGLMKSNFAIPGFDSQLPGGVTLRRCDPSKCSRISWHQHWEQGRSHTLTAAHSRIHTMPILVNVLNPGATALRL